MHFCPGGGDAVFNVPTVAGVVGCMGGVGGWAVGWMCGLLQYFMFFAYKTTIL